MADDVLVLGTHNRGKVRELVDLLSPLPLRITALADYRNALEVEETGDTFAANACLKARQQARQLRAWTLGEDSGISIDMLDGRPGVFSARYAGVGATDERNNNRLLEELGDTPLSRRTAYYTCRLALSDPQGTIRAEGGGVCRGRIRLEPSGSAGFGYDPLFEVVEYHRTFGELGEAVKAVLSHRTRAVAELLPLVERILIDGKWPEYGLGRPAPPDSPATVM